ncbi:MAG TPA: ATP-binding protein [Vicinamibacterales bacterium]|nr:ATP-binding protein [Vicinamibacterales bacterium]
MANSVPWISWQPSLWRSWLRPTAPVLVVAALLCLGFANLTAKAAVWRTFDDGVLWKATDEGIVAAEIAADGPATARLERGDSLLAIDGTPVLTVDDAWPVLQAAAASARAASTDTSRAPVLSYTVIRPGSPAPVTVALTPKLESPGALYFVLAAVGVFTLLVGGAVRLRRPTDPATLHFFWLSVAFFGVLTFSFTGQLNRVDWVFYWADEIAMLALPPLFLHFTLVFPDRPRRWRNGAVARAVVIAAYVPAIVLGSARAFALSWQAADPAAVEKAIRILEGCDYLYLAVCVVGGLIGLSGALTQVCTITARRQLRWIALGTALGGVPFALFYALPYSLGVKPVLAMELFAIPLSIIPLAYASAIVRYRLLDIEIIVKRSVVYVAALCALVVIYAVLLQAARRFFRPDSDGYQWVIALLATLIAVLLVPPVKNAVQTLLDRAFYRDRYDYRRALVGFARDLNSDLDLNRLAERLVSRVMETLLVDRMALMLESDAGVQFTSVRASGFGDARPPALARRSGVGSRLASGHIVALDDPMAVGRFTVEEIEFWRDAGLYYFVPCVAKEGTIAVLALGRKSTGAHLNSEDTALLAAVTGQIATALENARLYRQLHVKALELDRMRTFNENILESLDDGLLVLNLNDRVLRWNTALEQLYGITSADATGCSLDELFDAPFVEAIRAARQERPGGATIARLPLVPRGERAGSSLTVNAAVVPLRASAAAGVTTIGTIVIVEDVTARVQLEEQLQISEKMASIGLLAAGVAHEVNTPLTGISSFTQMLLEGADPEDPRTRLLEKIERQTFRAARIVNGLLNLSRPVDASAERVPVDLNAVITDVLALLEHQFETHRIKVRRELSDTPMIVLGMEHKLQQVFLNLFLNAKDAMPKGGWLSISTRREASRIIAEVGDTGAGIPSENLTRIYDPFFTTKVIGEGTGLGLSISYGIIREHDGSIDCESAVGQGTRFILSLPSTSVDRTAPAAQRQTGIR